ncbi:MAG: Ig-like domain-containing protein [Ruminococcus sp.]|nr:Ig-like domain-containing protein [Ruminococcus sp.]
MKKCVALVLTVFLMLMSAIPASASSPLSVYELATSNFRNYYEYKTEGKKIKTISVSYITSTDIKDGLNIISKSFYLIKFTSEDAIGKTYYNTFGENGMYYERSDVTNLLYPSGLVVCEANNMYTGYHFEYDWFNPPTQTFRDASEWTDDDFMSVEKACNLDPSLAEALVNKSENIGIVPVEERPTESSAETTPTESPTEINTLSAKTTVTVKNAPKTLYVKGTAQINADVKNGKGATTYKSSNTKVAKVSTSGNITALKKGTATITVSNNGVSKKFTIKVKNPKLNKSKKTLKTGKKFTLKIAGKVGKAKFTSNNKKVATVNKNGKITAKKKGKATITVKTNGMKLKCKITVK